MFRPQKVWDARDAITEFTSEDDLARTSVQRSTRCVDVNQEGSCPLFVVDLAGFGEAVDQLLHFLDGLFGDAV